MYSKKEEPLPAFHCLLSIWIICFYLDFVVFMGARTVALDLSEMMRMRHESIMSSPQNGVIEKLWFHIDWLCFGVVVFFRVAVGVVAMRALKISPQKTPAVFVHGIGTGILSCYFVLDFFATLLRHPRYLWMGLEWHL